MNECIGFSHLGTLGLRAQPSQLAQALTNRLFAALPSAVQDRLSPHIRIRAFRDRHVLWDKGTVPDRIVFPLSGMISLVIPSGSGTDLDVGSVGIEAAIGFESTDSALVLARAVVRIGGLFASLPTREFEAAARECPELDRLAPCCNAWLLCQAQQTAVCNAVHSADRRFARWLSRTARALGRDTIQVTQDVVAELLGLRRTTVTLIAQTLQNAEIIRYRRGVITIVDHDGLHAAACSCSDALGPAIWPSEIVAAEYRNPPSKSETATLRNNG